MKILWVRDHLLHPVEWGGRVRTYSLLKHLKRRGNEITYITIASRSDSLNALEHATEYCDRLVRVPYQRGLLFIFKLQNLTCALLPPFRSRILRAIEREIQTFDYDLVVSDFLWSNFYLPRKVKIPSVLFQHNVESMIFRRRYENAHGVKRAILYHKWVRLYQYERTACRRFNAIVAVSRIDRDYMRNQFGLKEVYDFPTGVDTQFFHPTSRNRETNELVFIGSMDYEPNVDAILHFAKNILPLVSRHISTVKLTVVGWRPTQRLIDLARSNKQIKIVGRVEDVRPHLERANAFVVPIRIGSGTRLKIYEAMAMEKPVISTSIGAEGLPVRNEENLLIADDDVDFANAVVRVLSNQSLANRLGHNARKHAKNYDWEYVASEFEKMCQQVVRSQA